jgi:2-C-methyl-D-erythritol 4-phosphate cytidylyltransferase
VTCHLLIPAAGSGKRMGHDRNKLLLPVLGKPILQWTLEAVIASESTIWIGLLCQPHDRLIFQEMIAQLHAAKPIHLIQGGVTRQDSVYNGLQALPSDAVHVLIHDGARCLATPELFERCAEAVQIYQGFVAAVPVKDTIKAVDDGLVTDTPNRDRLWAAQTPQGFHVEPLKSAHAQGRDRNWSVTDDAALFEKMGLPVQIVMGEETNLKITTPQDLAIAEFILKQRET